MKNTNPTHCLARHNASNGRSKTAYLSCLGTTVVVLSFLAACGQPTSRDFSGDASGNDDTAQLSWNAPTTNADNSVLTDLAGYRIYWGTSGGTYGDNRDIGLPDCETVEENVVCRYALNGLDKGAYFFAVTAYNAGGYESIMSNEVSKTF